MKCEEFEAKGLDSERDTSLSEIERVAARDHVSTCARCAMLQESWLRARRELRALGEATVAAQAPARVEMRLRQEFRTQHRTLKARRTAVIAAWSLAAAAILVAAISWQNWKNTQHENSSGQTKQTGSVETSMNGQKFAADSASGSAAASMDASDFTLLPGALPTDTDDAAILRVRMQRGSLGALGLPVNEERAGEWIQVDLLVGNDGLPRAVRLRQ